MAAPRWRVFDDAAALTAAAAAFATAAAGAAIAARGRFLITLSGGDTPGALYRRLRDAPADWGAWHVFFGDERCAAPGDPARNDRMAAEAWLDHVPIPAGQIHRVPAELGPEAGAGAYARVLRGTGPFDLVLLGLGEDGHTAALFPGHDWGAGPDAPDVLAVRDAPKPPPARISLSARRLAATRASLLLAAGAAKAPALAGLGRGDAGPVLAAQPAAGLDVFVTLDALPADRAGW